MKAFVIFSVLLALAALPANFLFAGAEPVLDTDNHPIRPGHKYYILPSSPGAGGGLTLALNQGRRCPYEIVQIANETNKGTPVTFSTDDDHDDDRDHDDDIEDVDVDDDVNIKFVDFQHGTHCPESKVWKFEAGQQHGAAKFVTVGGVEGKEGPKTLSSWFKIQKEVGTHGGRSYKFQYCPDSCDHHDDDDDDHRSCRPAVCGDIGVVVYEGRKRLAVNESPFSVVFKKVPTY